MKIGKLPSLPWYLRLVAFLAIGGVMYAGFWYFVTSGTRIIIFAFLSGHLYFAGCGTGAAGAGTAPPAAGLVFGAGV